MFVTPPDEATTAPTDRRRLPTSIPSLDLPLVLCLLTLSASLPLCLELDSFLLNLFPTQLYYSHKTVAVVFSSLAGKNVMAASPLDSSSIPYPAAVAADAPGSPNDPMEDTYTQSTRKRPRLDSGDHSNESMTMSVPSPSSASGHCDDDKVAGSDSLVPHTTAPVPDPETPNPQRPSSRVTINMKSPTLHDDSASHTAEETPAATPSDPPPQYVAVPEQQEQQHQTSMDIASHTPAAISITSSPSHSPEIEVAEVEDMDQDPSTSNWRSLEDALRTPEEPDLVRIHDEVSLAESFPRLRQDCDIREAIEETSNFLERGNISFSSSIGFLYFFFIFLFR